MNFASYITYYENRKVVTKSTPAPQQIKRKQIGESKTTIKKK